jgi:hypothetical protein
LHPSAMLSKKALAVALEVGPLKILFYKQRVSRVLGKGRERT